MYVLELIFHCLVLLIFFIILFCKNCWYMNWVKGNKESDSLNRKVCLGIPVRIGIDWLSADFLVSTSWVWIQVPTLKLHYEYYIVCNFCGQFVLFNFDSFPYTFWVLFIDRGAFFSILVHSFGGHELLFWWVGLRFSRHNLSYSWCWWFEGNHLVLNP